MRRIVGSDDKSDADPTQIADTGSDDEEDFTVHMQSWRSGDDEKSKKAAKSHAVAAINGSSLDIESKLRLLDIYHSARKQTYSKISQTYNGGLRLSRVCASSKKKISKDSTDLFILMEGCNTERGVQHLTNAICFAQDLAD